MTKILIIDSDPEFCAEIKTFLEEEYFSCQCEHDGIDGQKRFLEDDFDLIILAAVLPGIRGVELLKNIRQISEVPIIIITFRQDEADMIIGLELGADDYLKKPISMRELLARINSLLRRSQKENLVLTTGIKLTEFEGLRLDSASRSAYLDSNPMDITSIEYDLLEALMSRAGIIVSRETISQKVLHRIFSPLDRSIDVHISKLRKKIGTRADGSPKIKTVRGAGYIFVTD